MEEKSGGSGMWKKKAVVRGRMEEKSGGSGECEKRRWLGGFESLFHAFEIIEDTVTDAFFDQGGDKCGE